MSAVSSWAVVFWTLLMLIAIGIPTGGVPEVATGSLAVNTTGSGVVGTLTVAAG